MTTVSRYRQLPVIHVVRMTLFTRNSRLTVKPFAAVPKILELGLEAIVWPTSTISSRLSNHGEEHSVPRIEGCLITKTVKYTHQLTHWINTIKSGDPVEVLRMISMPSCSTAFIIFSGELYSVEFGHHPLSRLFSLWSFQSLISWVLRWAAWWQLFSHSSV